MTVKVCLVSFCSYPQRSVASLRADYWFKNIHELSQGQIDVVMLTASLDLSSSKKIFIPSTSLFFIDQGVGWFLNLFKYLIIHYRKYDLFVLTGGPFFQFIQIFLIKYFFRKKVVLDYRDPFANNPVFVQTITRRKIKELIEIFFNLCADEIITVNRYCAELLNVPPSKNISIIDNGFNDKVSPEFVSTGLANYLVLAGGFSHGRQVKSLELSLEEFDLIHLGSTRLLLTSEKYHFLGLKSYEETLSYIQGSSVCLVFTSGHPYESTTKIFDYLRFNKKILIISDVILEYGSLWDLTKDNPNVFWVRNNPDEIHSSLNYLIARDHVSMNFDHLSRAAGTKKLIKIILKTSDRSL